MLKDLLGETLQGMLEAEMDDHLGYSKYDYKNKGKRPIRGCIEISGCCM